MIFNYGLFSFKIKHKLEKDRLSLRDAAEAIDTTASTLSRLQRSGLPDLITYKKVCKWLGEDMDIFFSETDVKLKYNLPYRVGKKQKRVVLDRDGIQVVAFEIGKEEEAQEYCDYMNSKINNV